jgi:hypothetical protein
MLDKVEGIQVTMDELRALWYAYCQHLVEKQKLLERVYYALRENGGLREKLRRVRDELDDE